METKFQIYSLLKSSPGKKFSPGEVAEALRIKERMALYLCKKLSYSHPNIRVNVLDRGKLEFYYERIEFKKMEGMYYE